MRFMDRTDAGQALARSLDHLRGTDLVVLGLPRGGVPVAYEVAKALGAPLDVIVVRKLGVPYQPELAMGAIGEGGIRVSNDEVIRRGGITPHEIAAVEQRERADLVQQAQRFRAGRPNVDLAGRTAVIVDDGIATGSTAAAACQVARQMGATRRHPRRTGRRARVDPLTPGRLRRSRLPVCTRLLHGCRHVLRQLPARIRHRGDRPAGPLSRNRPGHGQQARHEHRPPKRPARGSRPRGSRQVAAQTPTSRFHNEGHGADCRTAGARRGRASAGRRRLSSARRPPHHPCKRDRHRHLRPRQREQQAQSRGTGSWPASSTRPASAHCCSTS